MKKFINLTNHPSNNWGIEQLKAAAEYGGVIDCSFPQVNSHADEACIKDMAVGVLNDIMQSYGHDALTIHVMGEMTFVYAFVRHAHALGITCVASTTERVAVNNPDGTKTSTFKFVKFRKY